MNEAWVVKVYRVPLPPSREMFIDDLSEAAETHLNETRDFQYMTVGTTLDQDWIRRTAAVRVSEARTPCAEGSR